MLQGTIEGYEHSYALDDSHVFERDRPTLVCGNTAAVLGEGGLSHLAKHFQVGFHLYSWKLLSQQCEGRYTSNSSCDLKTGGLGCVDRLCVCCLQIVGDRSHHFGAFQVGSQRQQIDVAINGPSAGPCSSC